MAEPHVASAEIKCPGCAHVVAQSDRCSHCGVRLKRKNRKCLTHYSAIALIAITLTLLNYYLSHREPPLIHINEISPRMNFATVRVAGELESNAYRQKDGSAMYLINDGTGVLAVYAEPPADEVLPKRGRLVSVVQVSRCAAVKKSLLII